MSDVNAVKYLADFLGKEFKKDDLIMRLEALGLEFKRSALKKELADNLAEAILSDQSILFDRLPFEQIKIVSDYLKSGAETIKLYSPLDFEVMEEWGLVKEANTTEDWCVEVDENLKSCVGQFCDSIMSSPTFKQIQEIEKLIIGLVHTFGILDVETLCEMITEYTGAKLDQETLEALYFDRLAIHRHIILEPIEDKTYLVYETVDNVSALLEEINACEEAYPLYELDLIKQWGTWFNVPTVQGYKEIDNFLKKAGVVTEYERNILLSQLWQLYNQNNNEEVIFNNLLSVLDLEADQEDDLWVLMKSLMIYLPQWKKKGYSENHLEQLKPQVPIVKDKIPGRNDACSCGSGKKYKKCCGVN